MMSDLRTTAATAGVVVFPLVALVALLQGQLVVAGTGLILLSLSLYVRETRAGGDG